MLDRCFQLVGFMVVFSVSMPVLPSTSILKAGSLEYLITRRSLVQIRPLHPQGKPCRFNNGKAFVMSKKRSFDTEPDRSIPIFLVDIWSVF